MLVDVNEVRDRIDAYRAKAMAEAERAEALGDPATGAVLRERARLGPPLSPEERAALARDDRRLRAEAGLAAIEAERERKADLAARARDAERRFDKVWNAVPQAVEADAAERGRLRDKVGRRA